MNKSVGADPDYAQVAFCICHFSTQKNGERVLRQTFDAGVTLYSFDELQGIVAETYAIWTEVSAGRVEEIRRRGTVPTGGFGF